MTAINVPTLGGTQFWADRRYRAGWRVQENVVSGHCRVLDATNRRRKFGSFETCVSCLDAQYLEQTSSDVVVLLHGLGRNRKSLNRLSLALQKDGHRTIQLDYPSTRRSLDAHVSQVLEVLENLEGALRISFVTHSLGGIVARGVLASPYWPEHLTPGRVVMIAPPNQGAALARKIKEGMPLLFSAVVGPSGVQIAEGVPYPEPRVPVMVIAGAPRQGAGLNPVLDGEDDGVVMVAETKLSSMEEHLAVNEIHTTIMNHPEAEAATLRFLRSCLNATAREMTNMEP